MAYCEDYPCCGHTIVNPCWREYYDQPDYQQRLWGRLHHPDYDEYYDSRP